MNVQSWRTESIQPNASNAQWSSWLGDHWQHPWCQEHHEATIAAEMQPTPSNTHWPSQPGSHSQSPWYHWHPAATMTQPMSAPWWQPRAEGAIGIGSEFRSAGATKMTQDQYKSRRVAIEANWCKSQKSKRRQEQRMKQEEQGKGRRCRKQRTEANNGLSVAEDGLDELRQFLPSK